MTLGSSDFSRSKLNRMKVKELIALLEADEQCFETGGSEKAGVNGMRYLVVVEKGPESFGAYVPDLPGCIAAGESKEEVPNLIREAIEFHIEGLKQDGLPVPPPSSSSEVVEVNAA